MSEHEQKVFNAAVGWRQAKEWQERTEQELRRRLEPLGWTDRIALLRRVEATINNREG